MSTRSEQVEACRACWDSEVRSSQQWAHVLMTVKDAAATLTRDGELRERLANLCANARAIGHPQAAALAACVEALLKEFP